VRPPSDHVSCPAETGGVYAYEDFGRLPAGCGALAPVSSPLFGRSMYFARRSQPAVPLL